MKFSSFSLNELGAGGVLDMSSIINFRMVSMVDEYAATGKVSPFLAEVDFLSKDSLGFTPLFELQRAFESPSGEVGMADIAESIHQILGRQRPPLGVMLCSDVWAGHEGEPKSSWRHALLCSFHSSDGQVFRHHIVMEKNKSKFEFEPFKL